MCARAIRRSSPAFTLLEVMIATMIVGMIALTLYRFLGSNLNAIRISSEVEDERESMRSIVRLLEKQLSDLPLQEPGALAGQPYKFNGLSNDEITWRSGPGPGLMTTAATGEYRVTLTVQPVSEKSGETELGLRRQVRESNKSGDDANSTRGGGDRKYNWLPLIRPMAALEIRYFDERTKTWLDSWVEPERRPNLVRMRLWKRATDTPLEAVLPVPSARLQP